jgi:hypothetical protein
MLTKLKNVFIALSGMAILLSPALVPAIAHADPAISTNLCSGSNVDLSGTASSNCTDTTSSTNIGNLLTTIINVFSVIVGVVAVIMIIFGGLRYIISGGDSGNVSGAKNTIIFALVGLIIVALAQVIVHFVLAKVGNTG